MLHVGYLEALCAVVPAAVGALSPLVAARTASPLVAEAQSVEAQNAAHAVTYQTHLLGGETGPHTSTHTHKHTHTHAHAHTHIKFNSIQF